jgi:hypothetical protein
MMPCSSGNSPTMSVSRSILANSAARSARLASAPSFSAMLRAIGPGAARGRPAIRACGDRPPHRGERRAWQSRSCGPGCRRSARPRGVDARRARCRDDMARVVDLHVGDDQELVEQFARRCRAAGSTSGSAAWSGSGTPAALRGIRLELADIDRRPFDQRGHLVEQAIGRIDAGREFPGGRRELRGDRRPSLGKGGDDLARQPAAATYSAGCRW